LTCRKRSSPGFGCVPRRSVGGVRGRSAAGRGDVEEARRRVDREVLQRLRADPRTRDIPVVIASADASPGRVRQLLEEGAFAYLTKPLDLHEFLDVVAAALASPTTIGPTRRRVHRGGPGGRTCHRVAFTSRRCPATATTDRSHGHGHCRRSGEARGGRLIPTQRRAARGRARPATSCTAGSRGRSGTNSPRRWSTRRQALSWLEGSASATRSD